MNSEISQQLKQTRLTSWSLLYFTTVWGRDKRHLGEDLRVFLSPHHPSPSFPTHQFNLQSIWLMVSEMAAGPGTHNCTQENLSLWHPGEPTSHRAPPRETQHASACCPATDLSHGGDDYGCMGSHFFCCLMSKGGSSAIPRRV